jgi:transposase
MKWLASLAYEVAGYRPSDKTTRSRRKRRRPAVDHVAIDVGGRESQICVRSSDGKVVEERRVLTASLPALFAKRATSRVVLETCAEGFALADAARSAGHEVRVVPATLVKTLGVGARRLKTDRRDAQVLSEVSTRIDLPSVHVPSSTAREWKTICGLREILVGARTKAINAVRGWLRGQLGRVRTGTTATFPARVREKFTAPSHVERVLCTIDALNEQIRAATKEVEALANGDALCRRLMTVPGIGPVTALRFVAAVDRVDRFKSAHQVESYIGLVPGERSSSDRQHRLSITKAGSTSLRWALVQAAWSARRTKGFDPMVDWSFEVEKRRGKRVACVALARKLAGVLFALWRDGTTYDVRRSAAM